MIPIPSDASIRDARWEPAFLQLAHGLVRLAAKSRVIQRFTGVSARRVSTLYRELGRGRSPAGPMIQGSARFFAIPSSWTSSKWNIQCAAFIACYEEVGKTSRVRLNQGWQLMTAYEAYSASRTASDASAGARKLDVNTAYALLVHAGFLESASSELQRVRCDRCMLRYLVVRSMPLRAQRCPMCSIGQNRTRLARQGFGG